MKFEDLNIFDIGNKYEIIGVVYGNDTEAITIMLPSESERRNVESMYPTLEQWTQIIRQSDILEVEIYKEGTKAILRKSTRNIEQSISWQVFRRDGYMCRYCGIDTVPLTVDHIVLWEEGGPTIPMNLITACKKCNNKRGNMQYQDWIESDYYKKVSEDIHDDIHAKNIQIIDYIPLIKDKYMRINKRKR